MAYKSILDIPSVQKPIRVSPNDDKFFGRPINSEEADDVLFALQAQYGDPKLDYEEARGRFTPEEVEEAVNWVKKKGFNKFTYFNGDPYGEGGRL